MGCVMSHKIKLDENVEAPGIPIVNAKIVDSSVLPKSPDDDNGEFEWMKVNIHSPQIIELQKQNFVIGMIDENGYVLLRRSRTMLSTHRFATAAIIMIGSNQNQKSLELGDCRMGSTYITRDIIDGSSITMNIDSNGVEVYIYNGGSVVVSFPNS